jgi:hypothetical protein
MSILKNIKEGTERVATYKEIERFIFIIFRMNQVRSNYRSSEFYIASRELDRGNIGLKDIRNKLNRRMAYTFNEDGTFWTNEFYNALLKKYDNGTGYYGWPALRYFLYEYELSLLSESRQKKFEWNDLLKTPRDRISIEHIYPQTENKHWKQQFKGVKKSLKKKYNMSLGNMLLLSASINSSLQNDSFPEKKDPKYDQNRKKLRNGYSDGSHSEIEVSQKGTWGPAEIYDRSIALLKFLESRWQISFKVNQEVDERAELLFMD